MIDYLPAHSLYAEAISQDEEAAERYLESGGDQPSSPSRRLSDWTPEVEALASVVDKLSTVVSAVVGTAGGKPPRMTPYRRPEVAAERVRSRKRHAQHLSLVSRVLPTADPEEG